jgi:hypothetical protein
MDTFADRILDFYSGIDFNGSLPPGISIMNPYRDNKDILPVISQFYKRFYNDNLQRHIILGINPGRFGAGVTGIPFTDTKRLKEQCGISIPGLETYETSSVFVYGMIEKYGGAEKFYSDFYLSSICPLGFVTTGKNGKEINCNYYDSKRLTESVYDFMVQSIRAQMGFGIHQDTCFCLGTGKNFAFLSQLNEKYQFFGRIVPLEHPRFIMQYRSKQKESFVNKYIQELTSF